MRKVFMKSDQFWPDCDRRTSRSKDLWTEHVLLQLCVSPHFCTKFMLEMCYFGFVFRHFLAQNLLRPNEYVFSFCVSLHFWTKLSKIISKYANISFICSEFPKKIIPLHYNYFELF